MIKHLLIAASALFLSINAAFAINVTTVAGELATQVGTQTDATSINIAGSIDVRDFKFIADEMPNLTSLDLSQASIMGYSGNTSYFSTIYNYNANEVPTLCFFGKEYTSIVLPNNLVSIADGAMAGCRALSSVTLPTTLTAIGNYAFYDCDNLSAVALPASVQNIGQYAFAKCDNLATVTQSTSSSNVLIGNYAFWNSPVLSQVSLASMTTSIGASAFADCPALASFKFPDHLVSIGEEAFKGTPVVTADLSQNIKLTTIGRFAFADNEAMTTVKLPDNIQSLGEGAFFYNTALNSISIPTSITAINDFLFTGCSSLANEKIINEQTTTIGKYSLADWKSLVTLLIPSTVTSIGDYAMENCTGLESITTKAVAPPELGENVFYGITQNGVILYAPYIGQTNYKNTAQWKEFDVRLDPSSSVLTEDKDKGISAYFDASLLLIKSAVEIAQVHLYDVNGVELVFTEPHSSSTSIDTAGFNGNLYIVTVKTEENDIYNLKLIRR